MDIKSYISSVINYYEGDRIAPEDVEVSQRPDLFHDWDGASWVPNIARQNAAINAPIFDALDALDLKSIRAIREGDSVRVAALEAQAAALRATLAK